MVPRECGWRRGANGVSLVVQVNPHWEAAAAAARRRQLAHQQLHRQFQQLQQIQMAPLAACEAGAAGNATVPSDYV